MSSSLSLEPVDITLLATRDLVSMAENFSDGKNSLAYPDFFSVIIYILCVMLSEARRGCQIPWDLSYRWLWVQGTIPRSSIRAASALKHLSFFSASPFL